ncbi:DUF3105 domain-containing protein [Actinokineospora globicatena]|uniref:DUF3105 domain-containing protein n=1 Tax=Actinokineospora globicatena TaxID=103729 RepID=UPI0020A460AF|nr:DUF3105 domain-containing protein [Actinokineospora globicatena]MCP2302420.1 Protein of unknown function (DUF3105) [Actinokineospora globicatena]GLW75900.1 hypothetical protein Aglo01_03820 [Actinokineospora globicatena]GLW82738.1 hypothetical protein Aglo02_03790 [Actinokineospora globicatena]
MASGTQKKGPHGGKGGKSAVSAARASVVTKKGPPWGLISGITAIVLLAGGVFTYAYVQVSASEKFIAGEDNKDPSEAIDGVVKVAYASGQHVQSTQRVAYDQSPPFGGPHDGVWADCTGIVYPAPVRSENMVHTLEHGSVWIAYNPDKVQGEALDKLKARVEGKAYMVMSPYPGLDRPISLQSWGHQLKLDSADDERIDQFIKSLRTNNYQNPEPGGRCDSNQTGFDPANPPPFVAEKPGADAVGMDGKAPGASTDPSAPASAPASTPAAPTTSAAQPSQ